MGPVTKYYKLSWNKTFWNNTKIYVQYDKYTFTFICETPDTSLELR